MKLHKLLGTRLLAFVVLLAGLEAYLWSSTRFGQLVVTESSERFGWVMLPDQSRWSREGDIPEVINNFGYRDRDWDPPRRAAGGEGWVKDDGLLRVAVLGQSMTYGTSVAIEDTWPRALEAALAADLEARGDPRRVLVMNFAVQGYVLEQMERVYEDHVRPFRPDVLLVPLHMGDILPMPQTVAEADFRYRRPWFRTATRDLLHRQVVGKWIPRPRAPGPPPPDTGGLRHHVRTDPRNPALFKTWSIAGGHLNSMQERVQADGGRLGVVVLPTLWQLMDPDRLDVSFQLTSWAERRAVVHPEWPRIPILKARREFGAAQETLTRAIVARLQTRGPDGTPLAPNPDGLPDGPKGENTLPPDWPGFDQRLFLQQDVGHYNPAGHRLLGETVFARGKAADFWP